MWTDRVRVLGDLAPADWLAERMDGAFGTVTRTVPSGFAAYARVLHPAVGADGEPVTWAQVAKLTGRRVHPTVQWHTLVGSTNPWGTDGGLWPHTRPEWGNLGVGPLRALCDVLVDHTGTPTDCFYALWDGWEQLSGGPAVARPGPEKPVTPAPTPGEAAAPRLRLPGRDYLMLQGPFSAVLDFARHDGEDNWWSQSPNLFWPADRAWCVATTIDFDSTLVGGAAAAIDAILEAPGLEAWPVEPTDSLAIGAGAVSTP